MRTGGMVEENRAYTPTHTLDGKTFLFFPIYCIAFLAIL
jgi:hypothetical protein